MVDLPVTVRSPVIDAPAWASSLAPLMVAPFCALRTSPRVRAPPLTVRPLLAVRRSVTVALPVTVKSPVIDAPAWASSLAPLMIVPFCALRTSPTVRAPPLTVSPLLALRRPVMVAPLSTCRSPATCSLALGVVPIPTLPSIVRLPFGASNFSFSAPFGPPYVKLAASPLEYHSQS